jgi:hypothetical protein
MANRSPEAKGSVEDKDRVQLGTEPTTADETVKGGDTGKNLIDDVEQLRPVEPIEPEASAPEKGGFFARQGKRAEEEKMAEAKAKNQIPEPTPEQQKAMEEKFQEKIREENEKKARKQAEEEFRKVHSEQKEEEIIGKNIREKLANELDKKAYEWKIREDLFLKNLNLSPEELRDITSKNEFPVKGLFGSGKLDIRSAAGLLLGGVKLEDLRNVDVSPFGKIKISFRGETARMTKEELAKMVEQFVQIKIGELAEEEIKRQWEAKKNGWIDKATVVIRAKNEAAAEEQKKMVANQPPVPSVQPETPPAPEAEKEAPKELSVEEKAERLREMEKLWKEVYEVSKASRSGKNIDVHKRNRQSSKLVTLAQEITGEDFRDTAKDEGIKGKVNMERYLTNRVRDVFENNGMPVINESKQKETDQSVKKRGRPKKAEVTQVVAPVIEAQKPVEATKASEPQEAPANRGLDMSAKSEKTKPKEAESEDAEDLLDLLYTPEEKRIAHAQDFEELYRALRENGPFLDDVMGSQDPEQLIDTIKNIKRLLTGKDEKDKELINGPLVGSLPSANGERQKVRKLLEEEANFILAPLEKEGGDDAESTQTGKAPTSDVKDVPTVLRGSTPSRGPARPMAPGNVSPKVINPIEVETEKKQSPLEFFGLSSQFLEKMTMGQLKELKQNTEGKLEDYRKARFEDKEHPLTQEEFVKYADECNALLAMIEDKKRQLEENSFLGKAKKWISWGKKEKE